MTVIRRLAALLLLAWSGTAHADSAAQKLDFARGGVADFAPLDSSPLRPVQSGLTSDGAPVRVVARIDPARPTVVVATCDIECTGIELTRIDEAGNASGPPVAGAAFVRTTEPADGRGSVTVELKLRCSTASCAWALGAFVAD